MSEENVIPEKNARDLAQVAWNFANDRCLFHYIFPISSWIIIVYVRYFVSNILHLKLLTQYYFLVKLPFTFFFSYFTTFKASKFLSSKISVEKKWWENCVVEQNIREDISNQILDLYEQTGGSTISTIASRF